MADAGAVQWLNADQILTNVTGQFVARRRWGTRLIQ